MYGRYAVSIERVNTFMHFRDKKVAGKALACADDIPHLK